MQVKKETISSTKIKLIIEVTAEELKPVVENVYNEIGKSIKVQGFRPGKAPKSMVAKEVGQDVINEHILQDAIPPTFYKAIQQENLLTVGQPQVKVVKFVPTDGLTYEAEVEIIPEIKIPDLKKIKLKKIEAKIEKKDIEDSLLYLREMFAGKKEVDRAAKEKDRVEIDFEGSIGGVPFDGGKSKNHPLVIGTKAFIPGFEEELVGMKKEEEKEFEITFPADYGAKEVAGKKATFKVKMNIVEEVTLPELNSELAGKIGPFKSVEELKKDIEDKIKNQKEIENEKALEEELLKKVAEATKIEAPSQLVHEEVHRMVHEIEHNLAHSGLKLDQYLEHLKKSHEDFEKDLEVEANGRVKIGLLLSQVSKDNKIEATEKEIQAEIDLMLGSVNAEQKEEADKYYKSDDGKRSVENSIIAKKAVEWLKKNVTVN